MDKYTRIRAGIWAAEEIAKALGVNISKALDPLDPADFVTISLRLSRALRGAVAGAEGEALRTAIDTLDVDWLNITDVARDKVIEAARAEVAGLSGTVPDLIDPVLATSGASIIKNTRAASIDTYGLDIARGVQPFNTETADLLRASQFVYIKDQYGVRSDAFDTLAKTIVGSGLERGLGREDISEELSTQLTDQQVSRSKDYWNVVSTDFANKARTTTQLGAFAEAGIKRYRFDAILDEATSDICRLLHGRVFSVDKAIARTTEALSLKDPEDVKNVRPWVQTGTNKDGEQILYYERDGDRHTVAGVESSAVGRKDAIGTYSNALSNKQLEAAGVTVPPCHGNCRSTITTVE